MIQELFQLYADRWQFFLKLTLQHLEISLIAIVAALCIGLSLGILISSYRRSSSLVLGLTNFMYTIPSIALFGFLIPFSGIGDTTAIFALTVYALLPMVRNTYTGITGIDREIIEAARGMGSTPFQILYKIQIPLAFPVILSGLRNMVVMTIALAGIAAFIGAGGLGVAIYRGITTNNGVLTVAGSLLIAVLALLTDWGIGCYETHQKETQTDMTMKRDLLLLPLLAFFLLTTACKDRKNTIRIATKPMTEQFILGEMLKLLIEQDTGLAVEITKGIGGGTSNIHPAMLKGEFDIYPEYTGTGWLVVLKKDSLLPPDTLYETLKKEYEQKFHLKWLSPYGFDNTYSLAVGEPLAKKYDLTRFSDLARYPDQFIFGAEYDFFEIHEGYEALCQYYDLKFKKTRDMDIGLKYEAIKSGKVDVMNIFTTDGQLNGANLTVLKDDKNFFPSYYCTTVIREETLKAHPELEQTLEKMKGILTNAEMAELNYEVDIAGRPEQTVAADFLKKKGLLR